MSTKTVILDQNAQLVAAVRTSCDPSVADHWFKNKRLLKHYRKFCEILPKDYRTIYMQIFDGFVASHPKDPDAWIKYLKSHKITEGLNSTQLIAAQRGERFAPIYNRQPPLVLDPAILAAEPKTVEEQKEKRLNESKDRTDRIFSGVLTKAQADELSYKCSNKKCGKAGLKGRSAQARKGDELNKITEQCPYCGHKMEYG
jgi:hypothetical protein